MIRMENIYDVRVEISRLCTENVVYESAARIYAAKCAMDGTVVTENDAVLENFGDKIKNGVRKIINGLKKFFRAIVMRIKKFLHISKKNDEELAEKIEKEFREYAKKSHMFDDVEDDNDSTINDFNEERERMRKKFDDETEEVKRRAEQFHKAHNERMKNMFDHFGATVNDRDNSITIIYDMANIELARKEFDYTVQFLDNMINKMDDSEKPRKINVKDIRITKTETISDAGEAASRCSELNSYRNEIDTLLEEIAKESKRIESKLESFDDDEDIDVSMLSLSANIVTYNFSEISNVLSDCRLTIGHAIASLDMFKNY